ncbi:MAG TPA: Gfo/Idh/MocA family oxidoreductase [Mycobacteriales bacterium]|jgi:predicted dehydrogenase|nr:Gfo/Idh/MocA family oxidoreductase [Mycobacteriales bacterium]
MGRVTNDLRIGVLGAARITPMALVRPTARVPGAVVAAVAARDPQRAAAYARKHGIEKVHASYDQLLDDDSIEAIYNPLPNALHAEWTLKALDAGKHVLCEKPFTSNEAEARTVATAAEKSGLVVMEAYHYRYHPLAERMRSVVHTGQLGDVAHIHVAMCFPLPKFSDIRYSYPLGGGTTMDCCYAVHVLRLLGSGEPTVESARALLRGPDIDRAMAAKYSFAGGATGSTTTSMWSRKLLQFSVRVTGSRGSMSVLNFIAPQFYNRVTLVVDGRKSRERLRGPATYDHQLRAFIAAVRDGAPVLTPPEDAVLTMRVIDDIYRKAGLPLRGL